MQTTVPAQKSAERQAIIYRDRSDFAFRLIDALSWETSNVKAEEQPHSNVLPIPDPEDDANNVLFDAV
eukprot:569924-Amphidinium_carterae.1